MSAYVMAVVSISTRAVWARRARARASGPAPSSADEQPGQVAGRVAEPAGQPVDAVAVDHAVGDQPHRPAGHVRRDVPVGPAGGGVGQAALAGPEAGGLGGGGRGEERDILRRRACGPGRTAGSRCRWCGRRCRTSRRTGGPCSSPRGSRTRGPGGGRASSCAHPPRCHRQVLAGFGHRRRPPERRIARRRAAAECHFLRVEMRVLAPNRALLRPEPCVVAPSRAVRRDRRRTAPRRATTHGSARKNARVGTQERTVGTQERTPRHARTHGSARKNARVGGRGVRSGGGSGARGGRRRRTSGAPSRWPLRDEVLEVAAGADPGDPDRLGALAGRQLAGAPSAVEHGVGGLGALSPLGSASRPRSERREDRVDVVLAGRRRPRTARGGPGRNASSRASRSSYSNGFTR